MPVAERYAEGEAEYAELSNTPADLQIEVQKVRHPSRVHLDIETDDLDAEAARLEALGARKIEFCKRWWIMAAPTGQRFYIVRIKPPQRVAQPNDLPCVRATPPPHAATTPSTSPPPTATTPPHPPPLHPRRTSHR